MSNMHGGSKVPPKDMYWFAHGGIETNPEKCLTQRSTTPGECDEESSDSSSPTWKSLSDRKGLPDDQKSPKDMFSAVDGGNSLAPTSERDDRLRLSDKRMAVEERKKQLWEAEQERNDAVMRKHMEREAALEARRNAQRSNISFAFGSSVPRNVESLQAGGDSEKVSRQYGASGLQHKEENYETHCERRSISPFNYSGHSLLIDSNSPQSNSSQSCVYSERQTLSPSCWLMGSGAVIGDDIMSRSMTAAVPAPRGRRKNDLMPTVPYDRTATPTTSKTSTSSSTRKRSVSMTRLDQLAQPRRHYVEATKASSTASNGGSSSMLKDSFRSPTRPLSSASEQSGGSGRVSGFVNRRVRSSPRKPRPVSIAGTVPDQKSPSDTKVSPAKRSYTSAKKTPVIEVKKAASVNAKIPSKPAEKTKPVEKTKSALRTSSTPKTAKQPTAPKTQTVKQPATKTSTPKVPAAKKSSTNKKKSDILVASTTPPEAIENQPLDINSSSPPSTPPPDNANVDAEKNAKRIISEEEAKAALAEKRRLAREQAEREAELERQRQEELRREEEERIRKEEEEQKRMEEETLSLLEEHRRQEEEKLKKAIEEQERKEEEERVKREEELRIKAEQERKAHEEAEKQRIELEEKLRKEEEERAERKKRLEKIMSRTRGKASGSSPSGSVSSDQLDSSENPQDGFSSGANSLDSNEAVDPASGPASVECKTESLSVGNSLEANPTYEIVSGNESLNSNDIMMPSSETASQDNSMVIIPDESTLHTSPATGIPAVNIQSPVPSDTPNEPARYSELSVNREESIVSENVPVKDSFLNDEYVNNENAKSNLERSEIPSTLTESIYQPISEDNKYHENIEPSEISEKATEDVSRVECNLLETSDVDSSQPVTASDVVLSFKENSNDQMSEFISSEKSYVVNSDALDYEFAQTSGNLKVDDTKSSSPLTLEQIVSEEAEVIESNSRNSISSDMKLPDPIYETTSDEGSVSSEKHQQDFNAYMLHEDRILENSNQEPVPMSDDVFSEQDPVYKNQDLTLQESNPFSEKEEKLPSITDDFDSEQFHGEQSESLMESASYEKPITSADAFELQHSDLSKACITENPFVVDDDGNKENIDSQDFGNLSSSTINNPFASDENQNLNEFDIYADKENVQFTLSKVENVDERVNEMHKTCSDEIIYAQDGVNPFLQQSSFSGNSETNVLQHHDDDSCSMQENEFVVSDPVHDLKNQTVVDESCEFSSSEVNDVTIIKAEGSEDCIGIISSVEHDQISNDFPKQNLLNEHLKSNFEYASITDSEDSSLDSNLSQVMTVESEKELIGGLKQTQALEESEIIKPVSNNVDQIEHPFNIEHTYNGDSISKSNGTHFCATEIISNGHRMETSDQLSDQMSEFHEYVQIGGNDISSVDHSKTNIFENVDAIDFSKVSPDPFLAKGNSNQISGNPFLLQDDQKQVLVTPDFLN